MGTTAITTLSEVRAQQAEDQDWVNSIFAANGAAEAAAVARAIADRDHAEYPQYAGHWDDWGLAQVTTDLISKGGVQAHEGDIVLYRRPTSLLGYGEHGTFYSLRLGWDCSAPYGVHSLDIEEEA